VKQFLILLSFALLVNSMTASACADHTDEEVYSAMSVPMSLKVTDADYIHPGSVDSPYLTVKPESILKFSKAGKDKLEASFELIEKVVNSEEFKERFINFLNKEGERSFKSNKGLTNEEIYEQFMAGRELLLPDSVGEMNFYLKLYNKRFSNVLGWTDRKSHTIHINNKFFKNFKPHQVASNLVHEWLHKLGYSHTTAKEHDSVPYGIGYLVRELGEKVLNGEELK
jgi:hypothetical protein